VCARAKSNSRRLTEYPDSVNTLGTLCTVVPKLQILLVDPRKAIGILTAHLRDVLTEGLLGAEVFRGCDAVAGDV